MSALLVCDARLTSPPASCFTVPPRSYVILTSARATPVENATNAAAKSATMPRVF